MLCVPMWAEGASGQGGLAIMERGVADEGDEQETPTPAAGVLL